MESGFKTDLIGFEALDFLGKVSDSLVEEGFIMIQAFNFNDSVLKPMGQVINLSLKSLTGCCKLVDRPL